MKPEKCLCSMFLLLFSDLEIDVELLFEQLANRNIVINLSKNKRCAWST